MAYRDFPGTFGGFGEIVAAGLKPRRRRRKALDDPFLPPWAERADESTPDPFDDAFAPQPKPKPTPKKRAKRDDDPFVSGLRQAWQRGGRPLKRHRDNLALGDAVGPDAANRRPDVARVEALLGGAGALDVTATEGPTGYFGRRTDAAIRKVQRDRRLKVDGLIAPKGRTLKALMASLPRAPVPAFAVPKPGTKVGQEARAANGRLVDAVMKTRSAGIVPKLLADAAAQGPSGEAEVADFFAQLAGRNATRAREMATLVTAERARPDLPEEGEVEPEGGNGETPEGPDNEPPDEPKKDPSRRPKGNPCESYAFDVKDALNAHGQKRGELMRVEAEIHNNGLKLEALYAEKRDIEKLREDLWVQRADETDEGKGRKGSKGRAGLLGLLAEHAIRYAARPYNPATIDARIAEMEARQTELAAQREELRDEVARLWDEYREFEAEYQACLAEHGSDPEAPTPGREEPGRASMT